MSIEVLGEALKAQGAENASWEDVCRRSRERAIAIYDNLAPKHQDVVLDPGPWISLLGCRRSGKTYLESSMALMTGEANPGSIVIIGSLTLKQLRKNFWFGAPSGIPAIAKKFGLNIRTNSSELRWEHENGSIGYLLQGETKEALEYWRGLEADLYLIDECKSFAPGVLESLIDDIISPQRMSRRGRVVLAGTPGTVFVGPFWQSTYPGACPAKDVSYREEKEAVQDEALVAKKNIWYNVPFGTQDPWGRSSHKFWSAHKLSIQDNIKMPHQWEEAVAFKDRKQWADDHPTWRREYLGEWINTAEGLVYRYLHEKAGGRVTWEPRRTEENPTGLPKELGPWHLVFGLDLGFEDPTALVVAAWSESVREVRHVHDESHQHLTPEQVLGLLAETAQRFGTPEMVVADAAGLGKMIVAWFEERGIPIVKADKADKNDHIELINAEFASGNIKVIERTTLEEQLSSVQWDLSDGKKEELSKRGRLFEDKACPNDVTDAFLYLLRYCYHGFATPPAEKSEPGSDEWFAERERNAFKKAAERVRNDISQVAKAQPWKGSLEPGVARIVRADRWHRWH